MSRRSVGSSIARGIMTRENRRSNYRKIQKEAEARPESTKVNTPYGDIWMSPIENELYAAMRKEGLSPEPQYCIQGYFVDFAFEDVRVAIEADGTAFHSGDNRERDRKRDGILRSAGWTVKRFHGTTIHQRPENCAFVIKKEVETRRRRAKELAEQAELERRRKREALARPFQMIASLFRRR